MLTTSVKMVGTLLPKLSSSISRLPLSTMFFAGVVEDSGVPLERFDVQNTYYDNMGHFLNVVSSAKMSMFCHV